MLFSEEEGQGEGFALTRIEWHGMAWQVSESEDMRIRVSLCWNLGPQIGHPILFQRAV